MNQAALLAPDLRRASGLSRALLPPPLSLRPVGVPDLIVVVERDEGKQNRVSNGLSGELKIGVFKEVVEEDDEFAHDGGEGEFLGFAGGEQALIKIAKDGWYEPAR